MKLPLFCLLLLLAVGFGQGQEYINGTVRQVLSPWQLEVNRSVALLDGLNEYCWLPHDAHEEVTIWADIWLKNKTVSCKVVEHNKDGWPLVQATDGFFSINSVILEKIQNTSVSC